MMMFKSATFQSQPVGWNEQSAPVRCAPPKPQHEAAPPNESDQREAAKAQPSLSPSFQEHVGEWRKEDFRGPSGRCWGGKGGGSQSRMAVAFLAGPKPKVGKRRSGVKKRARDAVRKALSAEEIMAACRAQSKRIGESRHKRDDSRV